MNEAYYIRLFDYYRFTPLWESFKNLEQRKDFINGIIESRAKKNRTIRYSKRKISIANT